MSKGKYYEGSKNRRDREERLQKRELMDANKKGLVDPFTSEPVPDDEAKESEKASWVSEDRQKWYVLDTNLILSCVDVLYDPKDPSWRPPQNFRPNLDNAHLIIPETVFDELNNMKDNRTVNKAVASKAFRRLKQFFPNSERDLKEIMYMDKPISTGWKQQRISLLPLHRKFTDSLPWVPRDTDNDGWIAVTALPVNGTVSEEEIMERSSSNKKVVLLTNDNGLLSKASLYAVRTKSYSFDAVLPYTGLRELVVPAEMFAQFDAEGRLPVSDFEQFMPLEKPLVANEYIAMEPEDDVYPRGYLAASEPYANVARYHKDTGMLYPMRFMKKENALAPNTGIATYYDAMNDYAVSVIVVTGKAGTGKTYQIVRHSIEAIQKGIYSRAVLIVNPDNGVGYLPGSQEKKLEPMIAFCKDAIRAYVAEKPEFKRRRELLRKYGDDDEIEEEFYDEPHDKKHRKMKKAGNGSAGVSRKSYAQLLDEQVDYIYEQYFTAIPYKQAQGRSFDDCIVIVDEAQRIVIDDMDTFITRPGKNSLLVVCGDVNQIKYNSPEKRIKNGLIFTQRIYQDWVGFASIHLTHNMRSEAAEVANRNYEKVIEEIGELET